MTFSFVYVEGQAYAIFKKEAVAEMVIAKLDEGCLLLSNGRYMCKLEPFNYACIESRLPIYLALSY